MNLKPLITGLCAILALAVIAATLFALPPTATAQEDPFPTPTPSSPTPTPPPPPAETETPTPPPTDLTQPTPTPSPLSGPQQYCRDNPYIYSLEASAPTDTADADAVVLWWYDDGYHLPPGAAFTYRVARASAAAANPDDAAWVTLTEAPNITKWTDRPGPGRWLYRVGIINLTVDGAVVQNCATRWAETTVTVPTEQERREREAQRQLLIAESVRCAVAAFAGNFSAEARPVISRIIEQRVRNNFSDLSTLEDVASVSIMLCAGDAASNGFYGYSWALLWLFPDSLVF